MSVLRKYERQNLWRDRLGPIMRVRKIRKIKGKEDAKSLFAPVGQLPTKSSL